MSGNLKAGLTQVLLGFIGHIFSLGLLGAPVFFVIGGLIISLSVDNSLEFVPGLVSKMNRLQYTITLILLARLG